MLKFLNRFFKKETEKANVKIGELGSWLELRAKDYNSELADYIKNESRHLDSVKKGLADAAKELEEAEIEDADKILPKIKNVVVAARRDYLKDIEHLANGLFIDDSDEESISESCSKMQEQLDIFAKKTAREYFKTQHLFHKPLESIAEQLKELGKMIKELNKHVGSSKVFRVKETVKSAQKLEEDIALLDKFKDSMAMLEQQRKEKEDAIEKTQDDIDRLTGSQTYSEYKDDVEKLNKLKHELRIKSDEIYGLLAQLQSALKRYLRMALENLELLSRYINDPVRALADDSEFVIMDILAKVKANLDRGDLELRDEKKKKMDKIIASISIEKLNKLRSGYLSTEAAVEELRKKIESNTAQSEHEGLLKKKGRAEDELKSIEKEIDDVKSKTGKIDIDGDKQQIAKKIREVIEIEVTLE